MQKRPFMAVFVFRRFENLRHFTLNWNKFVDIFTRFFVTDVNILKRYEQIMNKNVSTYIKLWLILFDFIDI